MCVCAYICIVPRSAHWKDQETNTPAAMCVAWHPFLVSNTIPQWAVQDKSETVHKPETDKVLKILWKHVIRT